MISLIDGRSIGLFQLFLSIIGVYASWDNVTSRFGSISIYTIGCIIWTVIDFCYMCFLICASSQRLHAFMVGLLSSNTFPNLAPSLDTLLTNFGKDLSLFSVASGVIVVIYAMMATYWAVLFYNEVLGTISGSAERMPLIRRQTTGTQQQRHGIMSLGSLARSSGMSSQQQQPSPKAIHPFGGRGFRLGAGES